MTTINKHLTFDILTFDMAIVSRGEWLFYSANFKGLNSSAVSDVEQTRHVTLTVHKFIQDGGQYKRSVFVGRRF